MSKIEIKKLNISYGKTVIFNDLNLNIKENSYTAIIGPSSSGKTTTAKRLCEAIADLATPPLYLGTDDYFVERKDTPVGPDGKPDFEGLGALDLGLFNAQMDDLLAGKEVDIPEFDFIAVPLKRFA